LKETATIPLTHDHSSLSSCSGFRLNLQETTTIVTDDSRMTSYTGSRGT
jgi:hypothetical protein